MAPKPGAPTQASASGDAGASGPAAPARARDRYALYMESSGAAEDCLSALAAGRLKATPSDAARAALRRMEKDPEAQARYSAAADAEKEEVDAKSAACIDSKAKGKGHPAAK